jgi:WD40 repeat protein/Tfp pilus assembly protein PilF
MQTPPGSDLGPDDPAGHLSRLWRTGERPKVEDFLAQGGVSDPALVVTVLRVDQWERSRRGEWIPAESYLDRFPNVRADPERAIDVVFAEYLLREQLGQSPTASEYGRRFPEYARPLALQFELHRAMHDVLGCGGPATWDENAEDRPANQRTGAEAGSESDATRYPELPGYEVFGVLGRGGMGTVYRAWQQNLSRTVALKMLHAGAQASSEALARFRVEAEAVARLQHASIIQIHEVGEHAGCPYLVLELVEGPSLAQSLAGTPRPARLGAELVETLARAIHVAHRQGVVHRDLTPANILLAPGGTPKITDFGLAKLLGGAGYPRTQTGELLGTPSYMAPEQAASRHQAIGPATDVYALGAILYEVLTGRPPFKAESTLETLRQVVADEPVAPSRLQPRLPRDLETICLKCLRKEPAGRYASADLLADDVRRFLDGRPILARRSSSVERGWRWCRRNPAVAGWLASVAALLLVLAGGSFLAAFRLHRAHRSGEEKLWGAYLAQAQAARWSGRLGRRSSGLDALAKAALLPTFPERRAELRDEAIACMPLVDLQVAKQWPGYPPGSLPSPAFDRRLERYVSFSHEGEITVRRVADRAERFRTTVEKSREYRAEFSPDGRFLFVSFYAAGATHNARLWDLDSGAAVAGFPRHLTTFRFRPDARQLVAAHPDGFVSLFDLPAVTPVRKWNAGGLIKCLAYNPTGGQLAIAPLGSSEVRICDADTGKAERTLKNPTQVDDLAWRGDGRLLAAACGAQIQIWDPTEARLVSVLEGHENSGVRLAFDQRGDRLASYGWDGTIRLWDPVGGRQQLSFPGVFLGWGPDDRSLAVWLGSQLFLYDVAGGAECRSLPHGLVGNRTPSQPNQPTSVDFSPDGRLLASTSFDGVRIYRARDGRELGHLKIGFCERATFQADGDVLTYNSEIGLARWPVRNETSETVRIGPPALLELPGNSSPTNRRVACDQRGQWLAVTDFSNAQAVLLSVSDPPSWKVLRPHRNIAEIAVSSDGRWVATATWAGTLVKVWDTTSGSLAADLPGLDAAVAFSPDGRWLVAGHGDAYRFYHVGSWQPGPIVARDTGGSQVRGELAFSPDGRMLAIAQMVAHEPVVQLVDPDTGRLRATLRAPELSGLTWLAFSPDGTQLAAATLGHSIQVWDLGLVHQRLEALGLGHDFSREAPRGGSSPDAPPVERLTVVGVKPEVLRWFRVRQACRDFWDQVTELFATTLPDAVAYLKRARRFERLAQWRLAVADLDQAIRRLPDDPQLYEHRASIQMLLAQFAPAIKDLEKALDLDAGRAEAANALAWIYLTAPRELRDPPRALPLAQRAVRSRPDERAFRNTLGVAYYRLGQFAKAAETLELNVETEHPEMAFDLFFLAMSRHRMGQTDRARTEFERAVPWQQSLAHARADLVGELDSVRSETEAVLARPPGPR